MPSPSVKTETQRDRAISRQTIKLYLKALAVKPGAFAACWLSIPIATIGSVIIPFLVADFIQQLLDHHYHAASILVWWISGLMLANIGITWLWNHEFNITGIEGSKYLHRLSFKHLMNQDYSFFSDQYTGSLASYQQRLVAGYIDWSNILVLGIPQVVTVILGSIIALSIKSLWLGIITLACFLVITLVTAIAAVLRLKQRREVSYRTGRLAGQLTDSLTHAVTVKALAKEQREGHRLEGFVTSWTQSQSRVWESYIYADGVRSALYSVMFFVTLFTSLDLFKDGSISVATVALVQLYTIRMLNNTGQIAELIKRNETNMSDAYQMVSLLQQQPTVTNPAKPKQLPSGKQKLTLAFKNVDFSYAEASDTQVLKDFNLVIKPGEKVGIVGPSGAGKTSLTKLILRFYDVTGGSITINDIDLRDVNQQALRELIAYVPQEPLLFHRSIRENIAYAADDHDEKAILEAAKKAKVSDFADELPQGLDTLVGERGVKLSGGQRQRVVIARAMLHKAPILVLDEATSALDSETESFIQDALWQLMKGKTAVVIAHRLSTIQHMDRIVVINHGKLVEQGTHQQLLKTGGLYAKLWTHQSGGFLGDA